MPKKMTEFVIRLQQRGQREELAGPYLQRRDAVRTLARLLAGYRWDAAVRAVVYERPSRDSWQHGRDEREYWTPIAHGEKRANARTVSVTERRRVV